MLLALVMMSPVGFTATLSLVWHWILPVTQDSVGCSEWLQCCDLCQGEFLLMVLCWVEHLVLVRICAGAQKGKLGGGGELSPAWSSAVWSITRVLCCLGVVVPSTGDITCCCHCHPLVPAWWRPLLRSSQALVAQHSPQVLSWEFGDPVSCHSDPLKGL